MNEKEEITALEEYSIREEIGKSIWYPNRDCDILDALRCKAGQ